MLARGECVWLVRPLRGKQEDWSILHAVAGDIDRLGTRKDALDAFLEEQVARGFTIETRTDTHAIIFQQPRGIRRFTSGDDPGRHVVEVDEDGVVTMRAAEPRRA